MLFMYDMYKVLNKPKLIVDLVIHKSWSQSLWSISAVNGAELMEWRQLLWGTLHTYNGFDWEDRIMIALLMYAGHEVHLPLWIRY